jgi:aubergine-like protein
MKEIGKLVYGALLEYANFNKTLPTTIIFFRDGVGEGSIDEVRKTEIQAILNTFKELGEKYKQPYKPKFAEIIVTKKINDRFF